MRGAGTKAKKGLLKMTLPVGYVWGSDGAGNWIPTNRSASGYAIFETYRRLGVARRVVCELKQQGLEVPTRLTCREGYGTLV